MALACPACGDKSAVLLADAAPDGAGARDDAESGSDVAAPSGAVFDPATGLTWQRNVGRDGFAWPEAIRRCDALVLDGHDDWRLPSRIELVSIIDLTRANPALDLSQFPNGSSDWFWTSSPGTAAPETAWYVYFYFGYVSYDAVSSPFNVRCVRGPARAQNSDRFRTDPDIVIDTLGGLQWQRQVPARTFTFAEAGVYCAALSLGGSAPWRVPTLQEVQGIVDDQRAHPALDAVAFPDTPLGPFWTASTWSGTAALAWYVNLDDGASVYDESAKPASVRCVR